VPQHSLAQLRPRPQQTGLYGRYRDSQRGSQIAHWHFLDVTHYEYFAQQRRNAMDFSLQDTEHLLPAEFTFGVGIRSRQLCRSLPPLRIEVIQVDELCKSPLADQHQALVLDNPHKPGRKLGVAVELVNMLERLPAGVLRFLLRFAPMAEDGRCQIRASAAVTLDQFAKCISVALFR
jgi:hypothetical protein